MVRVPEITPVSSPTDRARPESGQSERRLPLRIEQKIAFSVAALLGGYLVSRCGVVTDSPPSRVTLHLLRETLVIAPLVGLCLAAVSVGFYSLSREQVVSIQASLSARRSSRESSR